MLFIINIILKIVVLMVVSFLCYKIKKSNRKVYLKEFSDLNIKRHIIVKNLNHIKYIKGLLNDQTVNPEYLHELMNEQNQLDLKLNAIDNELSKFKITKKGSF